MTVVDIATRKDNQTHMEERFEYDDMDRLTGITLKRPSGQDLHCAVTYDALGRMTSRQAVTAVNGTPQVTSVFSQPVFDNAKVHAITSAATAEGVFPSDAQSITYTGFDKVAKVVQGDDSVCFDYGHDRQRILMEEHVGGLTRTKQYWGACEYATESDGSNTSSLWRTFVAGPYGVFAVVETRSAMDEIHYVLKDNLGSWTTITDGNGTVEQRLSYDAWGNLRDPNTWANYTADDTYDRPMFDRGFTGHEHLADFGLINMNGRVYDPVMSSFLSADRFVQNPLTAQGFNRYSYCMNNPLRYVDPTGWKYGYGGGSSYPRLSAPKSPLSLIQDYLSDPCYITRQQLREAGIYDIEGGYGFYGGGGTMDASWVEGDGSVHHSFSQYVTISVGPNNSRGTEGSLLRFINTPVAQNANSVLGYVVSSESTLFGASYYSLKQPKNKKILDELGRSLRSTYEARGLVPKGSSGIVVGNKVANRLFTTSSILGSAGVALVGVDIYINDGIAYPSHLLDASLCIYRPIIWPTFE